MAKISKASVNRSLISRTVVSSLRTQGPQMAETLTQQLYGGQPPTGLTLERLVEDLADYLDRSTQQASELSSEVLTEAAQDVAATQAVGQAAEALLEEIQWQRSQISGTYGEPTAVEFGFSGTLPRTTDQLVELSTVLEDRLRKNNLPTQTRRARPALDRTQIADHLARGRTELEKAAGHDVRETRETQQARQSRDLAVDAWDADYRGVATTAVGLFLLARMPTLAERVRPTARRRQQLPDEIDLSDPTGLDTPPVDAPVADLDLEEEAVDCS